MAYLHEDREQVSYSIVIKVLKDIAESNMFKENHNHQVLCGENGIVNS